MKKIVLTIILLSVMKAYSNTSTVSISEVDSLVRVSGDRVSSDDKEKLTKILLSSISKKEISFGIFKATIDPKKIMEINLKDGSYLDIQEKLKAGGDMGGGGSSTIVLIK